MTEVAVFGTRFSVALCEGCAMLSSLGTPVPPEWVLGALALESGFNPRAANASGARGLWQKMPEPVVQKGKPVVLAVDAKPPPGCLLRDIRDPMTKQVTGKSLWQLYACPAPEVQIAEACRFWWQFARAQKMPSGFTSREALYCCNLAPARLRGGRYTGETVLYSANEEDKGLDVYWPAAYLQNCEAFGLAKAAGELRLRMRHLATGLDRAIARHRARYDAEVAAAYVANAQQPKT
jgi:hypothetical protein